MSSRTSSRSTLTIVPSTMSPSLKYLIVASIAAMKSSAEPMSLMATEGAVGRTSVALLMGGISLGDRLIDGGAAGFGPRQSTDHSCLPTHFPSSDEHAPARRGARRPTTRPPDYGA